MLQLFVIDRSIDQTKEPGLGVPANHDFFFVSSVVCCENEWIGRDETRVSD